MLPLSFAESEAAKVLAVSELEMFAQERITAGDNVSEVNEKLSVAKAAVYAAKNVAEINAAKNAGIESMRPSAEAIAVDLGLPSGLKWAAGNLGAVKETDSGLYYRWGDMEGHHLNWSGYTDSSYNIRIYNNLSYSEDAARSKLGGSWRIPTRDEWDELLSYTTSESEDYSGVNGILLTSKINGAKIFFPAAGLGGRPFNSHFNVEGHYWSSNSFNADPLHPGNYDAEDLYGLETRDAVQYLFDLNEGTNFWFINEDVYIGLSIRAVRQ